MNKEKEVKKNLRKKKLIKFLAMSCIILGLTKFVLDTSVYSDTKIQNRVNSNLPISVTVEDALYVKKYSIDKYLSYVNKGELKKAYGMFTEEYKDFKSFEEYKKDIEGIDFSTFKLQEVKQISDKTFVTPVEYMKNGVFVEETYVVLANKVNDKNMKISPDRFLYSFEKNLEFSKNGIEFVLEECVVNSDKITLTVNVKNNNFFEDVTITKIGVAFNAVESKMDKTGNAIIKARDSETFKLEFTSNYDIPKYLKVEREMEDTVRTYTFELEK